MELHVGPGLTHDPITGTVGANLNQGFWIYVTAHSSANYTWQEKIAQTGGTWADGPRSGTSGSDPAIDVNGNTAVTLPSYQWAERSPAGDVIFQGDAC